MGSWLDFYRAGRTAVLGSLAASVALTFPAFGQAAVTVGPDVNSTPASGAGCYAGPDTPPKTWSNSALDGGALVTSPIDGVVVRWRVKDYTGPGDLLRPTFRVLRASGAGNFTGAGSAGPVPGYHGLGEFAARLPIRAGDRIGIDTPCAPQNYVGVIDGGSYESWSPPLVDGEAPGRPPGYTNTLYTLLINADVEADADHDGFGDETQDSCPSEAAVHVGPCQGGSTQVGQWFDPVSLCDQATYAVTGVDSGTSYTVPAAGVLTSWRAQAPAGPHADPMKFKAFRSTGAAHEYTVLAESALQNLTGGGLASFAIRVPVQGGDRIGLYSEGNTGYCGRPTGKSSDTFDFVNVMDVRAGVTATYAPNSLSSYDVGATLERDADHDGFGDVTQDECATDPTTQGPCKAPPDTVAPKVLSLGFVNGTFRAARKGSSISRKSLRSGFRGALPHV